LCHSKVTLHSVVTTTFGMQLACVTGQERRVLKGHYLAKEKKQAKTEGSLFPFWSTPLIIFLQLPCTEDGGCYS